MKIAALTVALALGAATTAHAQGGTATYQVLFTSPGNPTPTSNIVVPFGTPVTAMVHVGFTPGIGGIVGNGAMVGPVLGLADGGFSLNGAGGGALGSWSGNALAAPYNWQYGTSAGANSGLNVAGVLWGTGFLMGAHPAPSNPGMVWEGTFTTGNTAGVASFTFGGLAATGIWAGPLPSGAGPLPFSTLFQSLPGQGGSITVIPAPATAACAVLGVLAAARRRR